MISITINGNIVINLGGTDDELLQQLNQLKEKAMGLKTQAELDAYVAQLNDAGTAANEAAQAEGQQVSQVIADLQAMIDNGVTDTSGLEAAVATLSGVKTNIENIYVAPEVEPGPPAEGEPGTGEPDTGEETPGGTEEAEPV